MNIVWVLNNYPPVVLAGAEFAAHRLNKWLLTKGYTVTVYIQSRDTYPSHFEGVLIKTIELFDCFKLTFDSSTIIISQLWATRLARILFDKNPQTKYIEFVHYVDNTVISPYQWTNKEFQLVYNSNDTKERALKIGAWLTSKPSYVIPPIIDIVHSEARTDYTNYPWITIVNFSKDKGADIFNQLALNDKSTRKYVGVQGSHGTQEVPNKNVELIQPTFDMDQVWNKTRILVVLSTYETWSMVASEAMMRGIPVLSANHIPSLKENCGDAAKYIDRTNINECMLALDHIESNYKEMSLKSIHQSKRHSDTYDAYKKVFGL